MSVLHLTVGAIGTSRLVHDDRDRRALLARVADALGGALLGHCLMDTHLHLVAEGGAAPRGLERALLRHARALNAGRREAPLLRGPVHVAPKEGPFELARALAYLHRNPVVTTPPIVERPLDYEWSSARSFAGLSRATFPDVARARALLGKEAWRVRLEAPPLADLEPAPLPCALPEVLLSAAAQAFGVGADEVAGPGRAPLLASARAVFVSLGGLEGWPLARLAPVIARTPQRLGQILGGGVDETGLRIARTLVRTPALRARLGAPWEPGVPRTFGRRKSEAPSGAESP